MTSNIEDVEEAKVEVEYDEPTDERDIHDAGVARTTTTTTPNLTTDTSNIVVPEEASLVTNTLTDDVKKDDTGTVKQIQMTVAADAPWKDRLWEGSLCDFFRLVNVKSCFCYVGLSFTHYFAVTSNHESYPLPPTKRSHIHILVIGIDCVWWTTSSCGNIA